MLLSQPCPCGLERVDQNTPADVPVLTVSAALSQAYAHWQAGQAMQAEQLCLRVLGTVPDQPDARHLLGLIAHAYGRADVAVEHLRAACRSPLAPAAYHSNLAEICRQQGLLDEAEHAARRAVALEPHGAEGWNNLGIVLQEQGQLAASLECLQRVAALMPDSPQAHNNLGNTCKRLGGNAQALKHYAHALELDPDYAQALGNLALALHDQARHDEALAAIRRAIEIDPLTPEWHRHLARIEAARAELAGRYAEAESLLRHALANDADNIMLLRQLAQAIRPLGHTDEARAILESIVRATPTDAGARFDLAELLLLHGDYDAGWREYRFRYRMPHTAMRSRHVQKPRWDGQPIAGKTLLIHDEQGYGDTFQFLQLVAWARQRSGARIILEINDACHNLAERSGGFDQIIRAGTIPPAFDLHCELMSLPLALGLRLADLPASTAYLRADPLRVERWRARLAGLPRPWAGLVWAGRPSHPNDAQRSLTLADLAPLAQPGVSFISLQKGEAAAQADTPPTGMAMVSPSQDINDFDDTAALITLLDVLVSVDSSPAHLAGALDCPVWTLLPYVPDWRWLQERADTPWYPSMRLFRQPGPGAWGPVLDEVATALRALRPQAGSGGA
ncbi:tetratricopeptide repeat protein [Achromobacter sp. ES-001]|nr:tetratricopeptide repeat protein [Achromobacter sp. ES-001]